MKRILCILTFAAAILAGCSKPDEPLPDANGQEQTGTDDPGTICIDSRHRE